MPENTTSNPYAALHAATGWSHAELARRGGIEGEHARRTAQRWVRGANEPQPAARQALRDEAKRLRDALDQIIPSLG